MRAFADLRSFFTRLLIATRTNHSSALAHPDGSDMKAAQTGQPKSTVKKWAGSILTVARTLVCACVYILSGRAGLKSAPLFSRVARATPNIHFYLIGAGAK